MNSEKAEIHLKCADPNYRQTELVHTPNGSGPAVS